MALHPAKEDALLAWINSFRLDNPVSRISDLQDGCLLLKFLSKLKGEEPGQAPVHLSQAERLSIISDFIRTVCQIEQYALPPWDSTFSQEKVDIEVAKVVLLLCYHGLVTKSLVPNVEFETELQMASMFRFVQQGETSVYLHEGLDKLLTTSSVINNSSTSSVSSCSDDGSPIFNKARSVPRVSFLELSTVASTSFVGSPIQEIMNTPQVQLRRLRKELAHEGDVRDELERELSEHIATVSEKEGQIAQLQHRLQRLLRDQEELEKDHKTALSELEQKNEGLLQRVHEVLKQCQDLKTDNSQKERKIDELTEENGTLASQVRNAFAQLARAEEEVTKLSQAHESSQAEWGSRSDSLQRELSQALTDREHLSEQIQILQGKISVLEDELSKVSKQLQEKGEVLGPIMERENLKQELEDLMLKLSDLEETISHLEKEKTNIEKVLLEERSSFERETLRLERVITDLQQSINNIREERAAQEQGSREIQETLTAHIAELESEIARLQQLEIQLIAEISVSAELRQQRGELEAKVASLEDTVSNLRAKCLSLETENNSRQQALDALRADLQNAQISLCEYERKLADHHRVVEENASLRTRISALDNTVALLQNEIITEKKRGEEILVAKEQQKLVMEEKFQQQEQKAHEMFAELETLSQELKKMKQQKVQAESYIEKLTEEGNILAASLTEERDQAWSQMELIKKAKDETEQEFERVIIEHQSNISKLQRDIEETVESLNKSESELFTLREKISSKDEELKVQQQELAHLQSETNNLKKLLLEKEGSSQQLSQDVASKDLEIQQLKGELDQKEEEIQSLKANINFIEAKSKELCDLHQREAEEYRHAISELKLQLAEAERQISEKVKTLEDLGQHMKDLKEELSIEGQKTAALENSFEASKKSHEIQEQTLNLKIAQLQHLADGHLENLEELLVENKSLKKEVDCQRDIVLQKEKEAIVLSGEKKALEETFAQLHDKLTVATTIATERQSELLVLQENFEHQENLRAKALEIEETLRKELERQVTELQAQVHELNDIVSEKETLLDSLHEKMKEHKDINQNFLQKSEEALQRELNKVIQMKEQLDCAVREATTKNELLESAEEKLKQMELLSQQKEALISETYAAKEVLEKTVAELCTKRQQDLDRYKNECQILQKEKTEKQDMLNAIKADLLKIQEEYQQELETLKKEKEHLLSVNQSLQSDCHNLQEETMGQQKALNALKLDIKNTQDGCQLELEELKKDKEHLSSVNQSLQNKLQSLQEDNKGKQEALDTIKAELHNAQNVYRQETETLRIEKEHLSSVNQSLQNECQSLQEDNKEKQEALHAFQIDAKKNQDGYQQELETLKKERQHLLSANQSLQTDCQNLQEENKGQQKTLNALKADLHNTQDGYQVELEKLTKEKDQLSSVCQSLKNEFNVMQEDNKVKQEALNAFKAELQNAQNEYQQEIETLKKEKEHLNSTNQCLQNECQSLQEDNNGKQEALHALKIDMQKYQDGYKQDLETFKKEKELILSEKLSIQKEFQSLQKVKMEQQGELCDLKMELQKSQEEYRQELETLINDKDHLSSEKLRLQNECQNLQEENKGQQEAVNALKVDLQRIQGEYRQKLEALNKEKEHLLSANHSLQVENNEHKEALATLQAELQNTLNRFQTELEASNKEKEHLSLVYQSLLEDCSSAKKLETELDSVKEAAQHRERELEGQIVELQVKITEFLTVATEREIEIKTLQQEVMQKEATRMSAQECETALRAELETEVTQLHLQIEEASKLASSRTSELNVLLGKIEECERLKQDACQVKDVLEREVTELHVKHKQELEGARQELETMKKEKDKLMSVSQSLKRECQDLQAENKAQQETLNNLQNTNGVFQQEIEALKKEKQYLSSVNQLIQRERDASQKLGAEWEVKLQEKNEAIQTLKEVAQERERQNQELQEQLKLKSEAVEHYKIQVEKAKTHYNGKKQQLAEEQETRQSLQASLQTSEVEVKALRAELKLASVELENSKASEKSLMIKVKNLEAQLDFADHQLREHTKNGGQGAQVRHRESVYLKIPKELQNTSTDSLDFDLDDSLNTVSRKPSVPGESSTPLVRSSERLAAKRHAQERGSLETLYFTPMNPRDRKRDGSTEQCKLDNSIMSLGDLVLDSTKKSASSVQRRCTTQVINITMRKKSPRYGAGDTEESYNLHASQSQPNLASQKTRPVSLEIFEEPGADKLMGLPGYRRSNVHSNAPPRATSTFCVGAEYEPEHVADDWMRIAELQARNKACLPHLKSSYPLESRPSLGFSTLPFTDEDVRTGDPSETIRRASMVPSQLMDSLSSHRLSLAPPATARDHAPSQPQRYSMLPGQISMGVASHHALQLSKTAAQTRDIRSTRSPLASKRPAGQVQDSDTPEAKKLVSCFPRPATPKSRILRSSSNSQNKPPSPVDRRQSMAFVIDNTPKKKVDSRLQRGINKLRNSAQKPSVAASRLARSGTVNSGSPQMGRVQRKSPRIASRKSPKIPTSAKKLMKFRMKV